MVGSTVKKGPKENVSSLKVKASKEKLDKRDLKEIREASEIGKAAYVEAVGMNESVETTGKVSEVLKDSGESKGDGVKSGGAKGDITVASVRANLLRKIPKESVMKRQIESEIKSEIKYLHRKAMKMVGAPSSMSYFEMSNLVKKIRELKKLLASLVKASFDTLKTLWMRYVHGVM